MSTFDRSGVVLLTLLGGYAGLLMATASEGTHSGSLILPGLWAGAAAGRILGFPAGVLVSTVANAAAYGGALYVWDRFLSALTRGAKRQRRV